MKEANTELNYHFIVICLCLKALTFLLLMQSRRHELTFLPGTGSRPCILLVVACMSYSFHGTEFQRLGQRGLHA
jgi:hypothetical protein